MSAHCGMTRSHEGLAEAAAEVQQFSEVLAEDMLRPEGLELQNLVTVAALTAHAAWLRTESRGVHQRLDHPVRDDGRWRVHTILQRGGAPRFEPAGV